MFRWIGVVFLIVGTTGIAWCYCREQKKRLESLKTIRQIYQFLQNEVFYAKASLPEACSRLAESTKAPFCFAFSSISDEMNKNNGCSFKEIWMEQLEVRMKELPLKPDEKHLLLDFPECLGYRDGQGQAEGLQRYMREADRSISQLEEELKSKNKVIMSIGVMSGIMLVILLL